MQPTVKNIPDDIHKLLKDIAKLNHRSLNGAIIYCLEKYLKIDSGSMLRKAQITRSEIRHHFSVQSLGSNLEIRKRLRMKEIYEQKGYPKDWIDKKTH
ncbi:MAG: hypothetical protein ACUZ8O_09380 [Candidatus Anammoxibacter sp.]